MKRIAFVLALVLVGSCTASNPPQPRRAADVDPVPPPSWWRDVTIVEPLRLSKDQLKDLDRVAEELGQREMQQMQRDALTAVHDLRTVLDQEKPSSDAIIAAGERVRSLRSQVSERQLKLLAAERLVLTQKQWQRLQDQLRDPRIPIGSLMDQPEEWRRPGWGRP